MSPCSLQIFYQLLVLCLIATLSAARPQAVVENQETMDNQPSVADLEKFYSSYRMPAYIGVEEPNSLERLQLQYRANPFNPNNLFSGAAAPGALWDPLRQLVNKRQTRYRQCYFNPISCFKK